jgi:transposase, IS5 family
MRKSQGKELQGRCSEGIKTLQYLGMKPRSSPQEAQQRPSQLFQLALHGMVNPNHPLVVLAHEVKWQGFDEALGASYSDMGRPAISTRLMVALHYLKYQHDLSDEAVVAQWLENPYWQYFSGMKYFEHQLPLDPSSLTKWRKRIGEQGAERLLKETLATGRRLKMITTSQLERVNVDTTVQEKHIRFPTDARLYDRMRERLVKQAEKETLKLRQTYKRIGKQLLFQQSRYAHAKQFKRAASCTRKLKTLLGRTIRDIKRKCSDPSPALADLLALAKRLETQQREDKNKLYSVHAPEVECIAKGKAHKRYEFGCKVSLCATSKGCWLVAANAQSGNPYDGHTLKATMEQTERLTGRTPQHAYTDGAYKKHDYAGECEVHIDQKRRGTIPKSTWKWLKRRAAIEPTIGHLKDNKRLDRNRLKGSLGDALNVIFSAAALNFAKLFKAIALLPTSLHFLVIAFWLALATISGSNHFKKVLFQ